MDTDLREKYHHPAQMPVNRSKKRYQHLRKRFCRQNIKVFRLCDRV